MVQVIRALPVRFFLWWWSLFTPQGVVGWVFGIAVMGLAIPSYQSTRPPTQLLSATEDDGLTVIGGQMIVKYHNIKNRYCRNSVTRWLYNPDFQIDGLPNPMWVFLGSSAAPPVPLGDNHFSLALQVPITVIPGRYHYVATTDYMCGLFNWLEPPTARSPDMIVNLVQPDAHSPPQIVLAPPGAPVMLVPNNETAAPARQAP